MAGLSPDQIVVGMLLRVIPKRWDAPAGTVVRVDSVGQAGVSQGWCFTVEWLNRPDQYGRHRHTSLNLFEEDLQDFEVHTGAIVQPPGRIPKRRRAMIPQSTAEQLCLPYGHDDTIPERPADRYFHLRTRPAWDFDVDL